MKEHTMPCCLGKTKQNMPQLEGPTTKKYTTMYRGALGEKGKIKSLKEKKTAPRLQNTPFSAKPYS